MKSLAYGAVALGLLGVPAGAQSTAQASQRLPEFTNPLIPSPFGAWDSDTSFSTDKPVVTGRSAGENGRIPQTKPNNDADTQGVAH